jgi:5-(carboxyamino)imidazole ribonucleotide synthase
MLALAARPLGYRIHTFSPDSDSPTGMVADREVSASYDDLDAVRDFVRSVDVVTFEFENVASMVAEIAAQEGVPVRPGGHVLHVTQHRLREKTFLADTGIARDAVCAGPLAGRSTEQGSPRSGFRR